MVTKICSKCSVEKSITEYYLKHDKPRANCKQCHSLEAKPRYLNNRERYNAYSRKWWKENAEKGKAAFLKRRFGMEKEDWDIILENQDFKCAICKCENTSLKNFHTDHNHKTGKVRGLLCYNCNSGIGNLKENIETLKSAIEYLKKFEDKSYLDYLDNKRDIRQMSLAN